MVAAIYSVSLSDMGQFVQRFQAELPRAAVHIDYLHPDRVYERVLAGTADLGLVSFPKKTPNLSAVAWREEEMVLTCSPKHALASRLALPVKDMQGQAYVHFDKDLVIRRRVDRFLREQKVAVESVAEFDSIENIKHAVSIGAGVALLPEPTVRREVKGATLVALPLFDWRGSRGRSPLFIAATSVWWRRRNISWTCCSPTPPPARRWAQERRCRPPRGSQRPGTRKKRRRFAPGQGMSFF